MKFPARLLRRVKLEKGPAFLGRPTLTEDAVYLGWDDIYRIDIEMLELVWKAHEEGCSVGPVCGDVLIIGNGTNRLAGLDTPSGRKVWSRPAAGGCPWRGRLLILESRKVSLLDPSTGALLEPLALPAGALFRDVRGDLLLYNRGEYDGLTHNYDITKCITGAFNMTTRKILWERPLLKETFSDYHASGESLSLTISSRAFIASKGDVGIFGCSLEDGKILWHRRLFVPQDVPVAAEGHVYVLTRGLPGKENAKFFCFDELTGEKIYETEHKDLLAYRPTPGTVDGDYVVYGNEGGMILAFRLSDGELVWSHRTRADTSQPSILGNRLYVTSGDGYLLVFEGKLSRKTDG